MKKASAPTKPPLLEREAMGLIIDVKWLALPLTTLMVRDPDHFLSQCDAIDAALDRFEALMAERTLPAGFETEYGPWAVAHRAATAECRRRLMTRTNEVIR